MKRVLMSLLLVILTCWLSIPNSLAAAREPWTTSRVQGSPFPPHPFQVRPLFPELRMDRPTSIEEIPGADHFMITEIGGKIHAVSKQPGTTTTTLAIDLTTKPGGGGTATDTELHPQFLENRFVFVTYNHPGNGGHSRVSRFVLSKSLKILPETEHIILRWPSGGHNGGCLEFGKEGYLYLSTGDGSGPNPPDALTTGQDVSDLLGAILRIDINRPEADRAYRIPPDNPFVGQENVRPEIWAYGFRNPWKIGVDAESGEVYAADNGWETWEIVHRVVPGGNGGWPVMEGPDLLRSEVPLGPTPIIPPFKAHPHTEANSVIGGPVYRGDRYPNLKDWFIYGDYITGTIWAVTPQDDGTAAFQTLADSDLRIASLTEGHDGRVYLVDYDSTEQIYEMIPTERKTDKRVPFPTRLSETGLFQSVDSLEPAPGVVPYNVIAPRWMDGARAQRWIAIPGSDTATLAGLDGTSRFPDGTVLVKHLDLPIPNTATVRRLETQILHYQDDRWNPYSYVWDEAGADATIADPTGVDQALHLPDNQSPTLPQTWHTSALNECRLCHNADAGYVLGFSPNQLQNQLSTLFAQRVLGTQPEVADDEKLVNPHDSSATLNDRARSYLHANCAMCHRPGGSVIASFYLRRDLSFEELQTNKWTGVGTFGMRNAKVIANGDPFRSVVTYRMSKLGYSRMPYIGTRVVDSAGVSLISDWIQSLAGADRVSNLASPPLKKDSNEAQALTRLRRGPNDGNEAQAIQTLTSSTEGSLALIAQLHRQELSSEIASAAIRIGNESPDSNIRGLFETFLPENERKARLGSQIDPNQILSLTGDAKRGETIFYGDGALCKNCHHPTDPSLSLGTPLTEITKKYPQRSELLRHILEPSLRIDEPYRNYTIEMTDGTSINGLIINQNNNSYVIKTAELEEYTFPKSEVRTLRASQQSPMPSGVLSDLSPQEAADLLAFLTSVNNN